MPRAGHPDLQLSPPIKKRLNGAFFVYRFELEPIGRKRIRHMLRHDELQRTNALLLAQLQAMSQERDQLKSRLSAARSRIEALIDRLPTEDNHDHADGVSR